MGIILKKFPPVSQIKPCSVTNNETDVTFMTGRLLFITMC